MASKCNEILYVLGDIIANRSSRKCGWVILLVRFKFTKPTPGENTTGIFIIGSKTITKYKYYKDILESHKAYLLKAAAI